MDPGREEKAAAACFKPTCRLFLTETHCDNHTRHIPKTKTLRNIYEVSGHMVSV